MSLRRGGPSADESPQPKRTNRVRYVKKSLKRAVPPGVFRQTQRVLTQKRKQFTIAEVNRHLGFDSNRYLRMLARRDFLAPVKEGKESRVSGYAKTELWPPDHSFFEKGEGAIGLAYFLRKWFRYGLQEWIQSRMRELESVATPNGNFKPGRSSTVSWPRWQHLNPTLGRGLSTNEALSIAQS